MTIVDAMRAEYTRYKALAEGAFQQLTDEEVCAPGPNGGSSIATVAWHISGNLRSRFVDFLTSDGEKPWRQREAEFVPRQVSRDELMAAWQQGWGALFDALAPLQDADLARVVTIRGQPLLVSEALTRSLAHTSYHVGQIVYVAKGVRGTSWRYLSIPPGQSVAYNAAPAREKPMDHARKITG
jgi:hypothetical protein